MQLVVVDPGLIAFGGHHTAFAFAVSNWLATQLSQTRVDIFANSSIDESLNAKLANLGCRVHPAFDTNFYQYFDSQVSIGEASEYIAKLANEYKFCIGKDLLSEGRVVYFYPCVSWEHAMALSVALDSYDVQDDRSIHIVCAMFNPGRTPSHKMSVNHSKRNFEIAFGSLNKHPGVKIYASDFELSEKYAELLERDNPVPIHPCYLVSSEAEAVNSARKALSNEEKANQVILYLGDAKRDKGFMELPNLLQGLLSSSSENLRFFIHYNIPWPDPELSRVALELGVIARNDSRVELHSSYLDDQKLVEVLSAADALILNYDRKEYAEKSSGILWLAGSCNTHLLIVGYNWLAREAKRLDLRCTLLPDSSISGDQIVNTLPQSVVGNECNNYKHKIYFPFFEWLIEVSDHETKALC